MKLDDVVASLSEGLEPLGWIVSFSLGGIRVPVDDAKKILNQIGESPDKWLTPIRKAQAYRSALSQFSVEEQTSTSIVTWRIERINKIDYLIRQQTDTVEPYSIHICKVAEIVLDENLEIQVKILDEQYAQDVRPHILALVKEYDERKTHYYHQHFRYMISKMLEQLDSIRWSGNSTYFVPVHHTDKLNRIRLLMNQIEPYKTTYHKSGLLCIPIPDVEKRLGYQSSGFRASVEDNLVAHIKEELDEMVAKVKEVFANKNSRNLTKTRHVKEFGERIEQLRGMVSTYEAILQRDLIAAFALIDNAQRALDEMLIV